MGVKKGEHLGPQPNRSSNPGAVGQRALGRNAPWHEEGWCYGANNDLMYPETNRAQKEAAKACQVLCPVQTACLRAALDQDERFGVWGGTTERERERLRKRKKAADARQG